MYTLILKKYIFFHFSFRVMPLSAVIHTKAKYKMNNELLQRYIAGDVTEAERKQVLEWIEESPEHLHAYKVQRKLYDITLCIQIPLSKMSSQINISHGKSR